MKTRLLNIAVPGLVAALLSTAAWSQMAPPGPQAGSSSLGKDVLTTQDKMAFLDINKDGLISRKEADDALLKDWKLWDSNNDGVIDAQEYLAGSKRSAPIEAPAAH